MASVYLFRGRQPWLRMSTRARRNDGCRRCFGARAAVCTHKFHAFGVAATRQDHGKATCLVMAPVRSACVKRVLPSFLSASACSRTCGSSCACASLASCAGGAATAPSRSSRGAKLPKLWRCTCLSNRPSPKCSQGLARERGGHRTAAPPCAQADRNQAPRAVTRSARPWV